MATVESILKTKGKEVYSVAPGKTIQEALQVMADRDIGAVMVMEGEKLMGIFTERDYARRGTLKGNPVTTPVKDVMTRQVYCTGLEQSAEACMAQMVDKHFRHMPVVKDSKVIGVISILDVVRTVVSDKETLVAGMENLIMGLDLMQ